MYRKVLPLKYSFVFFLWMVKNTTTISAKKEEDKQPKSLSERRINF